MKKFIASLFLLLPSLANASLTYTYDQTHLDGQTFTVSGSDYGYVSYLSFGENEFEYGFDMNPLYYSWNINLDPEKTSAELAKEDFYLIAVGDTHLGMEAKFYNVGRKNAEGNFDYQVLAPFFQYDPGTGKDYLSQLNSGFGLSLFLFTKWNDTYYYYQGEEVTIGFGSGNSWALSNSILLISEPLTSVLFGLPLSFLIFRKVKSSKIDKAA